MVLAHSSQEKELQETVATLKPAKQLKLKLKQSQLSQLVKSLKKLLNSCFFEFSKKETRLEIASFFIDTKPTQKSEVVFQFVFFGAKVFGDER